MCKHFTLLSPSPRPSPAGRGRTVPSVQANPRLTSAPRLTDFRNAFNGCSLSQRERARVRENTSPAQNAANIFTETKR